MRADVPMTLSATSRDEKVAVGRSVLISEPSVVRCGAVGHVPNRCRAPVALCAVASSSLRPSRVCSNRL